MSEQLIHQITMECLMNKDFLEKSKWETQTNANTKDTKFYKKRIIQLTKDILNKEPPSELLADVAQAFHHYVKTCVRYFKIIDKTDILQDDYKDFAILETILNDASCNPVLKKEEMDKCMMRSIKVKKPSLDTFVIKTVKNPADEPILPKQKKLNLKDPQLKTKGLKNGKKENINTIYENEKNIKKEEKPDSSGSSSSSSSSKPKEEAKKKLRKQFIDIKDIEEVKL
jgi:hypothetical protein